MSVVPKCPHCAPDATPLPTSGDHQDKPTQGTPHRTPPPPSRGHRTPSAAPLLSTFWRSSGTTGPWWQEVAVVGSPFRVPSGTPPRRAPPQPGQPRCLRQSALAPFPGAGEDGGPRAAPGLGAGRRVGTLSPPPREGTRPGQGYPQRGGNGGDPQRGVWMGVAGGKGQWRGGKCGCDVTGLNKAVLSLVPAGFGTGDTEWHLSMMGPGQGKVLSPSRSLSPFPLPPKYSPPCCPGTPGTTGTRFCPSPVSQGGGGGGGLWAPAGHPGVSGEWGN